MKPIETVDELVAHCKATARCVCARRDEAEQLYYLQTSRRRISGNDQPTLFIEVAVLTESTNATFCLDGIASDPGIPVRDDPNFINEIEEHLNDVNSDVRKVSTAPILRTFVAIDISDFTEFRSGHQLLVMNSLVRLMGDEGLFWNSPVQFRADIKYINFGKDSIEASLCTGDGYICVFENTVCAVLFACRLATVIEQSRSCPHLQPFHFRIGVHCGETSFFWDPGRKGWNYVGEGIIGSHRVLEAIGKDVDDIVFVSDTIRSNLFDGFADDKGKLILNSMINRGRRIDKHGNRRRVYELDHARVTPPDPPF